MSARRTALAATLAGLTGLAACGTLLAGMGPASSAEIRTETTLGGYSVDTNAAPFKLLVDDPTLPIPRPPDSAVVEADPAYSHAVLDSGPTSRGVGSVLWPGALFGDGMGTITEGEIASYPLKAEARYPDKPYIATQQDGGAFMRGEALGLDVLGTARMNPGDIPGVMDVGLAASTSTATVKDGVAIGRSVSSVSDVTLLGGVIKVGSVSTDLTVRSDGRKATSAGTTVVQGLTIGGYGYVVDDKGARLVGAPVPGSGPLPTNGLDPLKQFGLTVSGISQEHAGNATDSSREAKGLVITVDAVFLRSVLDQVPSQATDPIYSVISQMPKEMQGNLYYALAMTPKLTFILGAGQGRAAATLPLSFTFPPVPPLPPVLVDPVVPSITTGGSAVSFPPLGTATGPAPAASTFEQPRVVTVAAAFRNPFGGIPPGLVLLALISSLAAGWGLLHLRAATLVGGLAGPCSVATTSTLPDLRGA